MRKFRNYLFIGLFFALLAIMVACSQGGEKASIAPYKSEIKLTEQEQAFLLDAARKGLSGESIPAFAPDLKALEGAGAVVEVFLPPVKPAIAVVSGKPFEKTFAEAVKKAAADPNFAKIKTDLAKARVKVGVINEIKQIEHAGKPKSEKDNAYKKIAKQGEDGIYGFVLATKDGKAYFQIPELVLYEGWAMEGEKRFMGGKMVAKQLKLLSKQAAASVKDWTEGQLYAFTTFTFIDDVKEHGKPVVMFRAKNMLPQFDAESLKAATIANADYLAKAVDEKGKFDYIYYPDKDASEKGYSIVRHAGAAYGLFEAYNKFADKKYLDSGRRAMDYLLGKIEIPKEAENIALIMDNGSSVLGTNALAAMAFASMPETQITDNDRKYRGQLGESIFFFRMPEKGLFYTSFKEASTKKAPKKQALYYPGEAMLSLVRLYERTGEKKWWDAAKDIAPGQKKLWEDAGHEQVGNYCWVGQAWARMARIEKDPKLAEEYRLAGYSHADAVIKHQFTAETGRYPDYIGGADNSKPPRTTPTSARGESLAENYLTAKFFKDVEAQKKYGIALMQCIKFCIENQYSDQNSWFLPFPNKARGGIRGSLIALDIRIDYNQHLLTTMINSLTVPEDLKALGVTQW
jgi:hypothetical protein